MKTKEEKRNQQPSPPTKRTPLPYRNMRHMQENNKRNENGKETGMENQRGKDTGMQDNPTTPTLSDQKKAPFPTGRKKHPQTTRKKEEQTFSLLPKEAILPYRRKQERFSLPPAEKTANCRSPKRLPSLLQKAVLHFPYCQKDSLPYRRKNNVSLPTAENKITPR